MEPPQFFALLGALFDFGTAEIHALVAVFTRIGAVVFLLPGFGEQTLPGRVRIGVAIAFTMVVWPPVASMAVQVPGIDDSNAGVLAGILFAEAIVGLLLGLAIRLMVMALQLAGSIAAQATSVAQIFGAGVTPDPMPAIGNLLTLAGIAIALAMGLHIKAALLLIGSYQIAPLGQYPLAGDVAMWGVARAADAFALAFSLAAPFVIASFAYNIALGAINRAMPQLMVALVGAPAITAGALFILWLSGPLAIAHWAGMLDEVLANPLAMPG
ncbi:MAG: flagellar biosynthetic protein FliR [Pseudomonadota bacterium]